MDRPRPPAFNSSSTECARIWRLRRTSSRGPLPLKNPFASAPVMENLSLPVSWMTCGFILGRSPPPRRYHSPLRVMRRLWPSREASAPTKNAVSWLDSTARTMRSTSCEPRRHWPRRAATRTPSIPKFRPLSSWRSWIHLGRRTCWFGATSARGGNGCNRGLPPSCRHCPQVRPTA